MLRCIMKPIVGISRHLKNCPKRGVIVDYEECNYTKEYEVLKLDVGTLFKFKEDLDQKFLDLFIDEIYLALIDSSCGYEKVTSASIASLIELVSFMQVIQNVKRLLSILIGAEFTSLKQAAEEAEIFRYLKVTRYYAQV